MATWEFSTEVKGDPRAAEELRNKLGGGSMMDDPDNISIGMGFGMPGMSMTVSANGASATTVMPGISMEVNGVQPPVAQAGVSADGASVQMSLGVPNISMEIREDGASTQVGAVGLQMNVPSVNVSVPTPGVSIGVALPNLSISTGPAPVPTVTFGDQISITVSNPHRVGKPGEDERTEYDFTLRTNMREFYPYTVHVRSARYNDVRSLYERMCHTYGANRFPPNFPKRNFFGRFNDVVINERMIAFQRLMDVIIRDPQLRQSHIFLSFMFGNQLPQPHLAPAN